MIGLGEFTVPPGYTFERDLPSGRHGRASVFVENSTGERFVFKSIPKSDLTDTVESLRIRSDQIEKVTGRLFIGYSQIIEGPDHVTFVRQFVSANPISEPQKEWPPRDALFCAWKQIASQVVRLHSVGLVGLVLHPNNVFISGNSLIAATDLVLSVGMNDLTLHSPSPFDIAFVAPELLHGAPTPPSAATDLWSLGVLLCFLETQALPWPSKNLFSMLQHVSTRRLSFAQPVRREVEEVVRSLLDLDPGSRTIACDLDAPRPVAREFVFPRLGGGLIPSGSLKGSMHAATPMPRLGESRTFTSLATAARAFRRESVTVPRLQVRTRETGAMTGRDRPRVNVK